MKKKYLITGCNGMLGSNLVKLFKKKKINFYGFHRDQHDKKKKLLFVNLKNKNIVSRKLKKINPDIVIHTAGLVDIDLCEKNKKLCKKINIQYLNNLIKPLTKNVIFIFISSDQVYGRSRNTKEGNLHLKPLNNYGKYKLLSEKIVMDNFKNFIIIRTNIFGLNFNYKEKGFIHWVLEKISKKEIIYGFKNYFFHPINAYFLAEIIVKLVNLKFTGIINIGSKNKISKYNFLKKIYSIFNLEKKSLKKINANKKFFKNRNQTLSIDIKKLNKLGIKTPSIAKSISLLKKHIKHDKVFKKNFKFV
tara:strand:- start:1266 stop:2177 length:912 start_codon:yes stop_codon:yes gene_type:complete